MPPLLPSQPQQMEEDREALPRRSRPAPEADVVREFAADRDLGFKGAGVPDLWDCRAC